jgi:nucleotide-binding universal stress UspA family protein
LSRVSNSAALALERILVAVDADGFSDHAVRAGFELASSFRAKLELLHVVGTPGFDWTYVEDVRAAAANAGLLTTAWKAMSAHVKALLAESEHGDERVDDLVRVLPGQPARVILREARDTRADLIVLGLHRQKSWVDFGSTARHVLAGAPRAVWVQKKPFAPIRAILVPVDLSSDSLHALATACSMARVLGASVRAIHVFQSARLMAAAWPDYPDFGSAYALDDARRASEADFERTMSEFDWQGVEHSSDFFDGDPIRKILELGARSDLVALGAHGRTGIASAVLGNVAYSVMRHCDEPVLAIRHPERRFTA